MVKAVLLALALLCTRPALAAAGSGSGSDRDLAPTPGMLRFPITVRSGAPPKARRRRRRSSSSLLPRQEDVDLASQKAGFFYSIQLQLGTPPQAVNVGAARISQQLFGVATESEFAVTGIMGAGPSLDGWDSPYPTVIDNLATQGFTQSRAFLLDLRSIESSRGSVVFGGIDTRKFSGRLDKRPIIPAAVSPDGLTRYWVYLDGVTVRPASGPAVNAFDRSNGQPVLLDSGYTVSTLLTAIFDKMLAFFPGATKPPAGSNLYGVPCDMSKAAGQVDFRFGQTVINVPYRDFIWNQEQLGKCVLGVARDDDFPVLGDTFLRAAYVVYDWDNRNVLLANNEDCGSRLVPIGRGADAVPSVTGECGAAQPTGETTTTTPSNSSSPVTARPTSSGLVFTNSTATATEPAAPTTTATVDDEPAGDETPTSPPDAEATPGSSGSPADDETNSSESGDGGDGDDVDGVDPEADGDDAGDDGDDESDHGPATGPAPLALNGTAAGRSTPPTPRASGGNTTRCATSASSSVFTATFTRTHTLAVTSCAPAAVGCVLGALTTTITTATAVWSPEPVAPRPKPDTGRRVPSLVTLTRTRTVAGAVCPTTSGPGCRSAVRVITDVVTSTAFVVPQSTATWTIPRTYVCTVGQRGCLPGQKRTTTHIVTVRPVSAAPRPTPVPDCRDCRMPPAVGVVAATPVAPGRPPTPAPSPTPRRSPSSTPPAPEPCPRHRPQPPAPPPEPSAPDPHRRRRPPPP